jgi:hypothetical protein
MIIKVADLVSVRVTQPELFTNVILLAPGNHPELSRKCLMSRWMIQIVT